MKSCVVEFWRIGAKRRSWGNAEHGNEPGPVGREFTAPQGDRNRVKVLNGRKGVVENARHASGKVAVERHQRQIVSLDERFQLLSHAADLADAGQEWGLDGRKRG